MSKTLTILNGPNLNMLGKREPEKYGHKTLADVQASCEAVASDLGYAIDFKQSNSEGELVTWIQQARETSEAIIINPAAYTHTSMAIMDALNMFDGLVVEVHITNVHKRESFRHHSYVSLRADAVIAGCGVQGYELGIQHAAAALAD